MDEQGNVTQNPVEDPSIIVCPRAPFGIYYQNRLIVPRYETSSTTTIISDVLDYNTFSLVNEFSANRGQADITLGYAPFVEDQLLVLNKRSIHVISGISNGGERITEITRQHGIAGHNAYAHSGSYTYFVSSEGNLEVLVPQLDPSKGLGIAVSKVNMDSTPLSDMVNDFMERVNLDAIDSCVVHYAKNLVYFALPIDGARLPNCILIYDSMRSFFVGLDTFGLIPTSSNTENDATVHQFLIHDIKTHKHEVWVSANIGLFKYEKGAKSDAGWAIETRLKTRDYLCQSTGVKKFTRGAVNFSAEEAHDTDPHTTISVGSYLEFSQLPALALYQEVDENGSTVGATETDWLEVGGVYEVIGYDETIGTEILLAKPLEPNKRVGIKLDERGTAYELTRTCEFVIKSNTTSPSISGENKRLPLSTAINESLSSFNISRRGQSINVDVQADTPIKIDNVKVEAFVVNSRTVGAYE